MTASIMLASHAHGAKYTALVQHANVEARLKHEQMGFKEGWGAVLDQSIAIIKAKAL